MKDEKVSFGAKISPSLKSRIDAQGEETRIPIGVAIERLAEFWASMSPEEQKMFCYGTNSMGFAEYVRRIAHDVVAECLLAGPAAAAAGRAERRQASDAGAKRVRRRRIPKTG